ncbi:MAG: hypothetical protein AAFX39_11880 [Pseudomonadota bacterium]
MRSRLQLAPRLFVICSALSYTVMWVTTIAFVRTGLGIVGHPDCQQMIGGPLLWTCDGMPMAILVYFVNTCLILTLWAPVMIAAATVNVVAMPIAGLVLVVHGIGIVAWIYALVLSVGWLVQFANRLQQRA